MQSDSMPDARRRNSYWGTVVGGVKCHVDRAALMTALSSVVAVAVAGGQPRATSAPPAAACTCSQSCSLASDASTG